MKIPLQERSASTWIVIPSAIVVAVLAVMQYRWSTGVSEATAVRLADSLQMSLVNWQIDLFRYLSDLTLAMQIHPAGSPDPGEFNFSAGRALSRYPDLVSGVYLLRPNDPAGEALQLNRTTQQFARVSWPSAFDRSTLTKGAKAAESGWWFDPAVPALIEFRSASESVAIQLSMPVLEKIFADLSHTYFQGTNGLDYLVAVVSSAGPQRVLYSSDPGFGDPEPTDADGTIHAFATQDPNPQNSVQVFHAPSGDEGPSRVMRISWFPLLGDQKNADWRLLVRHRRGGALGAFVAEMRRRDLTIGFGILLVLVLNMGMLIITSHRAQRLAQLQMSFVTAVSHELRTPLTVIISGAENICNGVVETQAQMVQYGSLIGQQARQLFGLVERILLFAATRQGQQRYQMRSVDPGEVVDSALTNTAGLIEAGHFTVESNIESDLPKINVDPSLLSQCLQNLITNALKYGKDQHWLSVEARHRNNEVQIRIADRGIGITAEDLDHIFEPFYRGASARAAQVHGTGLGLPLSRSIAEAMGGRISVESTPHVGSTFTVHLPTAPGPVNK